MMQGIGSYVLQLCAGAFLIGILHLISGDNSQIKGICSLFLIFLALSPVRKIELDFVWELTDEIEQEAESITQQAQEETLRQIRTGIISRTQAYILDEAESLGADIQVVSLSLEDDGFIPVRVELQGDISPYDRMLLSDLLEEDLGIGKEGQIWKD